MQFHTTHLRSQEGLQEIKLENHTIYLDPHFFGSITENSFSNASLQDFLESNIQKHKIEIMTLNCTLKAFNYKNAMLGCLHSATKEVGDRHQTETNQKREDQLRLENDLNEASEEPLTALSNVLDHHSCITNDFTRYETFLKVYAQYKLQKNIYNLAMEYTESQCRKKINTITTQAQIRHGSIPGNSMG